MFTPLPRGERDGRGCLMNDLHKHFIAKVLRKNFTDMERLLRDIRSCDFGTMKF
jgi:hypothetical protein